MPSHLSFAEAAALPLAGLTAFRALTTRGAVAAGENVLIPGVGGGVAGFAVQFAAALGANVYVTSRNPEHIALATELGAMGGVDTTDEDWTKQLRAMVPQFDLVVDSIGGELFPSLLRVLRPGGRLVSFGASAGPVPELVLPYLFLKQIDVLGTSMGNAQEFATMLDLVTTAALRPHVGSRFPLADVSEAMRSMESGAPAGKIILEP
ncbi:MAG TPA: zinc-binding dehydrogenase, partial [Actinomycetaceae bacterium]|nr:zinc-binding dehydrogenase [Actinomycetaceae bacterium]